MRLPHSPTHSDGLAAEPSEVRFRNWLLGLAMLAGPPLLLFLYFKVMFPGLVPAEAMDFAQLGRNLSDGRGFTTFVLRPLALTHGSNPLAQPDVTHGPLYPFLLALAFGTPLGAKDSVAALVSGVFYVLTVPVLYLLGTRLFDRTVGMVSALIFAFNSLALEYAISGLHITLYVFLMTCLLLVVYSLASYDPTGPARFPRGAYTLAGIVTGLLYLTDPIFFWIMPVMLGAVFWMSGPKKAQAAGAFLLPLCVLVIPWMIRNQVLGGNAFFGLRAREVMMFTNAYPGDTGYRMMPGEIVTGQRLFVDVLKKIGLGIYQLVQGLPQISAVWVLAFFLPGLLFKFTDQAANRVRGVMIACLLAVLGGSILFQVQLPLFVSVMPVMLVFALACLVFLMQQAELGRPQTALAVCLLAAAVLIPLAGEMTLVQKTPKVAEMPTAYALKDHIGKDEVVLTDAPALVAWYTERPALAIPATDAKVADARKRVSGVRWLFLTEGIRTYSPAWNVAYEDFLKWNISYVQQRAALAATGKQLQVTNRYQVQATEGLPAEVRPLYEGLQGFTWIEPRSESEYTTVLATAPLSASARPQVGMRPAGAKTGP